MLLVVSENLTTVDKVAASSFIGLSIWERRHLQAWIRKVPEVLGEDLLIVSEEFDRFHGSQDRLDLLALDRLGNLVVIELKRDVAAGYADLQAVRYAAMVSSMTLEDLVPYFLAYHNRLHPENELTPEDARAHIEDFILSETFEEISNRPRIILCSEDFSQELTTSVLWLRDAKIDITCVRVVPYKVADHVVIVATRIIPLQEAKEYQIRIQQKEERQQKGSGRRARTMRVLIENGLVRPGDRIYLKNGLPTYMEYNPNDPIYHAAITGKIGQQNAVRWEKDDAEYSISGLTWSIFRDLHPERQNPSGVTGAWHWTNESGMSLWALAEDYLRKDAAP